MIGLDYNMDFLKSAKHPQTLEFLEMNLDFDLKPSITRPTRITTKTATLIDNVFLSQRLHYQYTSNILVDDISDHLPSIIRLKNQKKCKKEPIKVMTREMNKEKITNLNSKLSNVLWDLILQNLDTEETFHHFHQEIQTTLDEVIPLKMKTKSYNQILRDPWLTNSLKNCLNKQKRMYKSTLVNASTHIFNKYKTYRNTLQKVIRYSKHQYYLNKCTEYKNNSRKLWNLINSKITKCNNKTESIEKIKVENIYKSDPKSITSTLCKHFSTIGKKYAEKIPKSGTNINDYIAKITSNNSSLFLTPTTEHEVSSLITALPNKTSSGYNNINNLILKEIKENIAKPLTLLINRSILEGKFPQAMKLADICPLFKCKDRTDLNNYRPICLLLTLSKLLEKIIYTRVYNFLIKTK